jgi:hypothetical protein
MQKIEFWIVRKREDARKVAKAPPEVADAISNHPDCNPKCLMCGEDHESAAVMAWREPDAVIYTAGICAQCAEPSDEPRRYSGWAARFSPGWRKAWP